MNLQDDNEDSYEDDDAIPIFTSELAKLKENELK
jgi:hypothetical protein